MDAWGGGEQQHVSLVVKRHGRLVGCIEESVWGRAGEDFEQHNIGGDWGDAQRRARHHAALQPAKQTRQARHASQPIALRAASTHAKATLAMVEPLILLAASAAAAAASAALASPVVMLRATAAGVGGTIRSVLVPGAAGIRRACAGWDRKRGQPPSWCVAGSSSTRAQRHYSGGRATWPQQGMPLTLALG